MSNKKINFPSKPNKAEDKWVENRIIKNNIEEKTKRLTIDIPASLHTKIKIKCAQNGHKMIEEIRELLSQKYD